MGRQIVQRPNGNWSVWSTIVDDWLIEDATETELWDWYDNDIEREVNELIARRKKDIGEILKDLKAGKKPYGQFTDTFEELSQLRLICHSEYREKPWPKCTCKDGCSKCECGYIPPWKE